MKGKHQNMIAFAKASIDTPPTKKKKKQTCGIEGGCCHSQEVRKKGKTSTVATTESS